MFTFLSNRLIQINSHTSFRFGQVLLGISDLELYILDEFEDVEYERSGVDVFLLVSLSVFVIYLSFLCFILTKEQIGWDIETISG